MTIPFKKKLSVWRPLALPQYVLPESKDLIKASKQAKHENVISISTRIKKQPFHKVVSPYAKPKTKLIQSRWFQAGVFFVAGALVYFASSQISFEDSSYQLRYYVSKLTLHNFTSTLSDAGLKMTNFDRM